MELDEGSEVAWKKKVRDLLKANEVIDEVKQHENFTLISRVLDLTSCGFIGVSNSSLESVDQFGHPTDQDSKTVKVYPQVGVGCLWVPEASSMSLNAILALTTVNLGRWKNSFFSCLSRL